MRASTKYGCLLALAALLVDDNLVRWALAVCVGGHTLTGGFAEAYRHASVPGYLFFTAFRLIPYAGLGLALAALSRTKLKGYVPALFAGGLAGILALLLWGFWAAQRPLYAGGHVASTTALAFIFLPFYACASGGAGALLAAALALPLRLAAKRAKNKE